MKITVGGEKKEVAEGLTVAELIVLEEVEMKGTKWSFCTLWEAVNNGIYQ